MPCQVPLGGACSGCEECDPDIFTPGEEIYQGPDPEGENGKYPRGPHPH
ncbi:hypothetical protein RKE29_21715 [Streptomyces sp. B1866]|nr:hypothetical protein [Streptomyces sp. B1866]MDT3399234.1 hypothetical protein [Streptomyces sp. B1866]